MLRAAGVRPFRPLAQTVSVIPSFCRGQAHGQKAVLPATDCAGMPASTSWPSTLIQTSLPASALPLYPAQAPVRRSQSGRSGHAPLRFASLVTGRLAGGSRIQIRGNAGDISRPGLSACKTPSNQGLPKTHARTLVRLRPASPVRRPEKGYKYILREAAADAAAGAFKLA